MNNYLLKAHLKHLTLSGVEGGQLQWIGTDNDWSRVEDELSDYYFENYALHNEDFDGCDMFLQDNLMK